ncbi:MAG TPA: hypothetical protein VMF08_19320 [Candidatus Sulfotelmatobacter sp.]|nr:hypothetical protein [Candidatus Sulfotelmatobacter sp.]
MNFSSVPGRLSKGGLGLAALLFAGVLAIFLYGVFEPDQTLFSNDGPLGRISEQCHQLPQRFLGCWSDLNNIGFDGGAACPSISIVLEWLLGPVLFSKFYAFLSLLILGLGAWCFFHQSRLSPVACLLGGIAAMLTSTFFCVAVWGVAAHTIAAGMVFLALACLADPTARPRWLLLVLAGFAVGMDVAEAADVGAIFSVLFAAFAVYQALIAEGSRIKNAAIGIGKLALVIICAVFLAAQTLHSLVSTSITGISGTQQDVQTKEQRWGWATQWSLPKVEALELLEPGLFGFRLDTRDGGEYWGKMGRDAAWDKYLANGQQGRPPTTIFRYTGGDSYIGLLVALIALWAAAQSLRPKNSVFSSNHKKWLWFWSAIAVVSFLLALGRYAPFYQWFYALPYASTIRNPTKFLYLLSFAFVILFAFGVDALWRKYMNNNAARNGSWWRNVDQFDKNWIFGCAIVWVVSVAGWYIYWQHLPELEEYLESARLDQPPDQVAAFSVLHAGWFVLFFFLAASVLALIFRGNFSGKYAGAGIIALGLLLVTDLGLADTPWVRFWNYKEKYASNPIIDEIRDKPYEHRVALAPISWPPKLSILYKLYKGEWIQQQLPYYNIQTFETVEMPRMPVDFSAFTKAINSRDSPQPLFHFIRACQLINTRYIVGPVDFLNLWNGQAPDTPLELLTRFSIQLKPGISKATSLDEVTAVPYDYGDFALFEFPSALPRAKLYSSWQVNTNDTDVLKQMFSPEFNPQKSVFVAGNVPTGSQTNATNPPDDAVQFVSYAPKDIVLKADAAAASVLLLTDHFHPDWKVFVDGRPATLLRCNFLMRGVYLLAGSHTVEFKFQPPTGLLYVTALAIVIAFIAFIQFVIVNVKSRPKAPVPALVPPTPMPAQNNSEKSRPRKKPQRK